MKLSVILWTLITPILSFSQKTKTDYDYYENGQVHWKGEMVLKDNSYFPTGLWQYWHEDGKLKLETWDDGKSKTKYINMWLPTSEQILKNGQGFMYEIWPLGDNEQDSSIYEVKDSIQQGYVRVYRLYPARTYFLVMKGQFDQNSEKVGKWTYRDTIHGNAFECYYKDGKKNGLYTRRYLNGSLRDSGQYRNDYEEGEWKYFDANGHITKECSYKAGNLIGIYREYYRNGKLKIEGAYRQSEGLIKVTSVAAGSGRRKVHDKKIPNKEYKTGKWLYYSSSGKIVRTESINNCSFA